MSLRLKWLLFALCSAALLLVLDMWALAQSLFWTHRWIDIPMHILGGVSIGAFCVGLFGRHRPLLFVLLVALFATSWEFFEYVFGLTIEGDLYWLDTTHDLLNGAVGALAAYLVARKTLWR